MLLFHDGRGSNDVPRSKERAAQEIDDGFGKNGRQQSLRIGDGRR